MEEVKTWLTSLGIDDKYLSKFEEQEYNSMDLIYSLKKNEINDMIIAVGCKTGSAIKIRHDLTSQLLRPEQTFKFTLPKTHICLGIAFLVCTSLFLFVYYLSYIAGSIVQALPKTFPESKYIFAIGDLHGDFGQAIKILRRFEIIDEQNKWSAGSSIVVQTGDLIDRGPDDPLILSLVMQLEKEAVLQGGQWIQLLGNHEVMNLQGDFRYANDEEEGHGFKNRGKEIQETAYFGKWLLEKNVIYKWHDVVFVHAGISNISLSKYGINGLNRIMKAYMKGNLDDPTVYSHLLWDRSLVSDPEEEACQKLAKVLENLEARTMIVGHTMTGILGFQFGEIGNRCNNALFMIDVGFSRSYGALKLGEGSILHIERSDDKTIFHSLQ